jgi:hypothetical protein
VIPRKTAIRKRFRHSELPLLAGWCLSPCGVGQRELATPSGHRPRSAIGLFWSILHATLFVILLLSKASQTDPERTSFLRRALEWELQGAQVASLAFL